MRLAIPFALAVSALLAAAGPATKAGQKRRSPSPPPVSVAARQAARTEIEHRIAADNRGFVNPGALQNFFEALHRGGPVHVLQFGDSQTASDDWVNAMRAAAQGKYGDGGPGFVQAGHPYRGYRRFDALGASSAGWKNEGTMANRGDANQGLSGISISTELSGQTVTVSALGERLEVFYLQQPGGGELELRIDGQTAGSFSTSGPLGPGRYECSLQHGPHQISLITLARAPVRLFGWTLDNPQGVTFETLGINGAQANVMLDWNEQIWASEMALRDPALVILAYGTNEANSRLWTADQYRLDLTAIIQRIRNAVPAASIMMIGPPDCGRLRPLLNLPEVIDIQLEIARQQGVAFWDWRQHMGGPGSMRRWVVAGLAQNDFIHLTGDGYRLLGRTLFDQLENAHE